MLGLAAPDIKFGMNGIGPALDCGIVSWGNFQAGGRGQLSIEQTIFHDDVKPFKPLV